MGRRIRRVAVLAIGMLAMLIVAVPAWGAFPGKPGPIAYSKVTPAENEYEHAGGLVAHPADPGSSPLSLTGNPTDGSPAYSADGRLIAFESLRNAADAGEKGGSDIFVMRSDGSGLRRLTRGSGTTDSNPSFSPNGKLVVFQRYLPSKRSTQIFSVRLNGKGLRQLTRGRSANFEPTFSPNGNWIAFVSNRGRKGGGEETDIYSMRSNGSRVRLLVGGPGRDFGPDVSPDGHRIAFASSRDGSGTNVFVKRIGRRPVLRQLTDGSGNCSAGGCYSDPSWAPDARHIALLNGQAIVTIRANGGGEQVIENTGAAALGSPAWGPEPR